MILVDPACYDLANHFLEGEEVQEAISDVQAEANRRSLAEAIQSAIEDWFLMHPASSP
jgi:hypothetical protein